ncbi:hypothetical protein AB0953_02670 [Streptomyces sp. NPDC046866]|uniref:hypothetical protein n=1 Tax=Streptomyces sp. NPDC046866 TaxID=3154921 RepID=UPI0034530DF8
MDHHPLPRRTPGSSGRRLTVPEVPPGAPSRALRKRAADGWERFMRRADFRAEGSPE